MRKSIGFVLIVSVSVAVIIAMAGIIAYVSGSSSDLALKLERQAVTQQAVAVEKALDMYLETAVDTAGGLAAQQSIVDALHGDSAEASGVFKKYIASHADYWAMFAFDLKGIVVAGYNAKGTDMKGADRASRNYVKAVQSGQKEFITPSILKSKSGDGIFIFGAAHAVYDHAGKLIGGVAVFPKWETFTKTFLDPIRFGERGYGFILNSEGVLLAHAVSKDLILENISKYPFVQDALKQKKGTFFYNWQGDEKFMAFEELPKTGWIVCMSTYVSEMTETATEQRNVLMGVGLGTIIILIIVITLLAKKLVVSPVTDIEAFTRSIAEGDFSAVLHDNFKFEFDNLAHNIREMVAELKNKLGFAQGLLDGMTISCVVVDMDEKIIFANKPVVDFLEHSKEPDAYKGMKLGEFFYGDPSRETVTGKAIAQKKAITNVQAELTTMKGNFAFTQIDTAPLYDLDGNMIAGFALFSDLTELKKQQDRIEQQRDRIAKAAIEANSVSDQVASASEELSAQIEQASRGTEVQRNRTTEAATAMEEMNASVLEVASNASSAAESVDEARAKAQEGEEVVEEVVGLINRVSELAQTLQNDMEGLGKQAEDIGAIMNVISDIADQTNLLALNAAIEAARAGDAGRGFAVVADEVRKLAEKTMSATSEVGDSISAIQASTRKNLVNTEKAVEAVEESTEKANISGEALRAIVSLVEGSADQVRSIATASEEQSAASEEINRSTDEINRIAGETAGAMAEGSRAVSDLARLAQELKTIIDDMQQA